MPTADRQAPYVRISHEALRVNLDALRRAQPAGVDLVADLRRDAWGHGAQAIAETLMSDGVDAFVAEANADLPGRAVTDAALVTLDSHALLGLPRGGARTGVPVMRMFGHVLSLKRLAAGEGVSYGYTHRAAADTTVALVVGGYAQGIVRALGNEAHVAIGGRQHPIVGRVAMDVCVIDIGTGSGIIPGDEAVYFGDPTLGHPDLAKWSAVTTLDTAELAGVVGAHVTRLHSTGHSEGQRA